MADRPPGPEDDDREAVDVQDTDDAAEAEDGALPEGAAEGRPDAPDDQPDQASPDRRRPGRWLLAVLLLLALTGTLLGVVVVDRNRLRDELAAVRAEEQAQAEAVAAAEVFIGVLFNWDAESIDDDFDEILALGTERFRTDAAQFADPEVRSTLHENASLSQGELRSLYVQSSQDGVVTVFAVVDQLISNVTTGPVTDVVRVELELVTTDAGWAVDELTLLQSPAGA